MCIYFCSNTIESNSENWVFWICECFDLWSQIFHETWWWQAESVVVGDICWFGHHLTGAITPVGGALEPAQATPWTSFPVWTANSLKVGVQWCFIVVVGNGFLFYWTPPTLFDQGGETDRRTTLDVYSLSLGEGRAEWEGRTCLHVCKGNTGMCSKLELYSKTSQVGSIEYQVCHPGKLSRSPHSHQEQLCPLNNRLHLARTTSTYWYSWKSLWQRKRRQEGPVKTS